MKKKISLLLAFVIIIYALTSCNNTSVDSTVNNNENVTNTENSNTPAAIDIWDGSVASNFSSGNGTENAPYNISTAAELSFLAKSVNEGEDYCGKYFSLNNDLDLNNLEWTPIGNGIHSFMGIFDGNGHTIKNLKISESIHYTYEYPTGKKAAYCDSGLFATVQDASIQNIIIDGATLIIANTQSNDTHRVGVLCGTVRAYQGSSIITNIAIKNVTITTDFSTNQSPMSLSIGGAIGHIYAYNNTTTTISHIETNYILSLTASFSPRNYMGTVLGSINIKDATFNLENCAAYQTLIPNAYQYYYGASDDFCGAIGNAQASAQPFTVKNVFSKLTINKPALEGNKYFDSEIVANAIIGEAYYYALKDDPSAIGYKFENVFGCVEHVDAKTGEKNILTDLYKLPAGPNFVQTNCKGCEHLPKNHGFDTAIWDLSDLTKPKLKALS